MAETHFFMTRRDTVKFLEFLAGKFSASFSLDQCDTPEPKVFYSARLALQAAQGRKYAPRFFVGSPKWDKFPLCTKRIENIHSGVFYSIAQRVGGPAFDLTLSTQAPDSNAIFPGSIYDYAWYIKDKSYVDDHSRYETFDRPPAMAAAHKEVRRYFQKAGVRSTVC